MIISNISSNTTGPFVTKFHVEPPWAEGTKICSNRPGHMTNIWPPCQHILRNLQLQNQSTKGLETLYVALGT